MRPDAIFVTFFRSHTSAKKIAQVAEDVVLFIVLPGREGIRDANARALDIRRYSR